MGAKQRRFFGRRYVVLLMGLGNALATGGVPENDLHDNGGKAVLFLRKNRSGMISMKIKIKK